MREDSLRMRSRGKLALASDERSSINASMPAFFSLMLVAPPRRKSPTTAVWLFSRCLTSTLRPLTSNSVTSLAASSGALGGCATRAEVAAAEAPGEAVDCAAIGDDENATIRSARQNAKRAVPREYPAVARIMYFKDVSLFTRAGICILFLIPN